VWAINRHFVSCDTEIHYNCTNPIKFVQNMKDYQGDTNNSKLCRVIRQFHKIATSDCQLRHVRLSVCPSIRLTANINSAPKRRICMKFLFWAFFQKVSSKFKFHYNLTRITGNLPEDRYTVLIISRSVPLRMRNVADKSCK